MKGNRKFLLTLVGLVVFGIVMYNAPDTDPTNLGLGLGFLLAPMAASNAIENRYGKNSEKQ